MTPQDRLRVDALWTVSLGFGVINMVLAACMQARHMVEALRKGDRLQVLRAAVLEAAYLAGRAKRPSRHEIAFAEMGSRSAELEGTADARSYWETARGAALFLRGHWKDAQELLRKAESTKTVSYTHLRSKRTTNRRRLLRTGTALA